MQFERASATSFRSVLIAAAIAIGLIWTQFSSDIVRALVPPGVLSIPYGRSMLASLSDIVVMVGLVCVSARIGGSRAATISGLGAPILKPFLVYGLIFAVVAGVCFYFTPLATGLTGPDIGWLGFGGPFTEEVVYRGLAVGGLMLLAGWRFVPAVLAPALVFGLAHFAQGEGLADSSAIAAITAVGGLLFGWVFVRWGFNLWPAIFAHMGMNTLWVVFAFGETAIGGWLGNAVRLILIALIVFSAFWFGPAKEQDQNFMVLI